jgi:hypothetical protein
MKNSAVRGAISKNIDIGSAVGVATAETVAIMNTAIRHDFKMPRPVTKPAKFIRTNTTGITTNNAGGGGGHAHTLNNMNLKYVDCIIATKN